VEINLGLLFANVKHKLLKLFMNSLMAEKLINLLLYRFVNDFTNVFKVSWLNPTSINAVCLIL
jgi:hypothetical protein